MSPRRRAMLLGSAAAAAGARVAGEEGMAEHDRIRRGRALAFPRDHGAHPGARSEWWYATGWLGRAGADATPSHGFQITFFRSRTGLAESSRSRFAARQLLFAHAAVTDLAAGRHVHAQRIARWDGDPKALPDHATLADAAVQIDAWQLWREAGTAPVWHAQLRAPAFALRAALAATQPLLLQGEAGFSRKGPQEAQASHYYSLPQLQADVALELGGATLRARGRAWLDHEWSDELLHPQAVGWDWIGMNLFDGSALTAFQLRHADGTALWAGGSWRGAEQAAQGSAHNFTPGEVTWTPQQRWRSAATHAQYPVQWTLRTPAGRHMVRALLDAQELDSRASTGAIYWEGLAELLDGAGTRVGLGYLEMTGYTAPLRLG